MKNQKKRTGAAGSAAAVRRKPNKRRAVIVCTILAAVFIIAAAVVLMGLSDQRVYNDYMDQAQLLYYRGDYDGSLAMLRKAAAIEKTDECLMLMADCYETQGNYAKALEVLRMMDTSREVVSSRIGSIESLRKNLSSEETVTIAGRSYRITTTRLVLDRMGLTDEVLDELQQLYAIDSLSAADNELHDISGLSSLGGLVTLNLSGNNISDLRPLASLGGLRTLYLDGNPIEDLTPLYGLSNLSSLSIKNITVTESQLTELSQALPNCAIHSERAKAEKQEISFGGVTFDSNISDLNLSEMGVRDISALANCQYLTRLNLSGNNISDLSPLMNLPYLQWLDISYNQVSDLRPLMGMKTLSFLNASGNAITNTSALSMMNGLSTLYLDENPIQDFSGLRMIKSLSTLGLNNTGLDDNGLYYLRGLSNLTALYVEDNPLITGEAVEELRSMLNDCNIVHSDLIYTIQIDGNEVQTDAVTLNLSGLGVVDIGGIYKMTALESADLSGNFISNLYALEYAECRRTLLQLNLSDNAVSDAAPLAALTQIEWLDLANNDISDPTPLMNLNSLRVLVLTGNPLSTEQIEAVRLALVNCEVLF